jgi:predicted negative regulator of RcsB-dependent stress response
MNKFEEIYGIDSKKVKEWFKRHGITIVVSFIIGFSLGWIKTEGSIEMDCKYAKAVRIGTSAFECKRIL